MSDTTSEYAELLESLDPDWWEPDHSVHHSVAKTMREAADAIRALEAKVREAEHWNESCEAENRQHILALREHARRLEDARDRLAAENAKLRAFAQEVLSEYRSADMVGEVVFLDEEEVTEIMQKHALLDDKGNPTDMLLGREEQ